MSRRRAPKTREESKQDTRDALIHAGLAAFAEEGLDVPSLDAICARAGLTRGAFYVHFADREAFLVEVMDRVIAAFLDAVIATGDQARDLELTIDRFAAGAAAVQAGGGVNSSTGPFPFGLAFHRLLDACARSEVLRRRFVDGIREGVARVAVAAHRGQEAGTVRADVDADATAMLLGLVALGMVTSLEMQVPLDVGPLHALVRMLLQPLTPGSSATRRRGNARP